MQVFNKSQSSLDYNQNVIEANWFARTSAKDGEFSEAFFFILFYFFAKILIRLSVRSF